MTETPENIDLSRTLILPEELFGFFDLLARFDHEDQLESRLGSLSLHEDPALGGS